MIVADFRFKAFGSISCVLLSKLYLCRRIYSNTRRNPRRAWVVYCFQNCIFVGEFTALWNEHLADITLCIAFKIVSL